MSIAATPISVKEAQTCTACEVKGRVYNTLELTHPKYRRYCRCPQCGGTWNYDVVINEIVVVLRRIDLA